MMAAIITELEGEAPERTGDDGTTTPVFRLFPPNTVISSSTTSH